MTAWTWRDGQVAERSGASGLSGGFMPPMAVFAGERVNTDIYQELLRQHVVPWVQRDVAWQKVRPSADSAPAYAAQISKRLWRNSGFRRIGRHIRQTWIRWTSQLAAFYCQKARLRLMLIWRPYVRPSLRNNTGKRRYRSAKNAALSAAAVVPSLRKMKLKLNGWLAKGPAHTNQYFSGLI